MRSLVELALRPFRITSGSFRAMAKIRDPSLKPICTTETCDSDSFLKVSFRFVPNILAIQSLALSS